MDRRDLDRFFEELLAEPCGVEDPAMTATRTALASAVLRLHSPAPEAGDCASTAKLGAHLDGALDPAEAEVLVAALLRSGEIYDLQAARSFLYRISAQVSPVPPGLVAAVTADCAKATRKSTVAARRVWITPRWGWAAGAMAAVVAAVIAGIRISENRIANETSAPTAVATLQAPDRSDVANVVPPPPPKLPAPKGSAAKTPEPVYTAPNPPQALTSHAVTAEDYPPDSVRLQEQGAVQLKYTIETDGNVSDCAVTVTSGFPRLDDAACVMVKKWKFKPATIIGGTPVTVTLPADIVFRLAGSAPNPPGRSEFLLDGQSFNAVGVPGRPAIGTPPPTPAVATTSHAVTADDYPPVSIRMQEQGTVQIKYTIGTDGNVSECAVTVSSGKPRLDDAACTMAKKNWKFKPATQKGHPVAVSADAEVIFALK